jgi:hypothetical protein
LTLTERMLAKTDVMPSTSRKYFTFVIWPRTSWWFEKSRICAAIAPAIIVEKDVPRTGSSCGAILMQIFDASGWDVHGTWEPRDNMSE